VTLAAGANGAGNAEFCKSQCAVMQDCEFSVTQGTKCYLKNNIAGGTYGKTGASALADTTCVKGADNWLKFALQVSNQPAKGPAVVAGGPAKPAAPRRNVTGARSGAARAGGGGWRAAAGAAAALAAAALLALA
jgi:hypothetical protein